MLDDEDLHIAIDGLSSEYDLFSSAIRTHSDVLLVEELNTLLNAEDIKKRSGIIGAYSLTMVANFQS